MRCAVLLVLLLLAGLGPAGEPATAAAFVRERLVPVLLAHCWECHGRDPARPKGMFSVDTLAAMQQGGEDFATVIRPGDPGSSHVYLFTLHRDGDDMAMPPKYRMPQADIDVIREWIAIGAPWPAGLTLRAAAAATAATTAATAATSPTAPAASATAPPSASTGTHPIPAPPPAAADPAWRDWTFRAHPAVVHLPIGALIVAVLLELVAAFRAAWRGPVTATLLIAVLGAAAAVVSGLAVGADDLSRGAAAVVDRHELAGWTTLVLGCLAMAWSWRTQDAGTRRTPATVLIVLAALAASVAGHLGGVMVHGPGWPW